MMKKILLMIVVAIVAAGLFARQGRVAGVKTDTPGEIRGLVVPHYELARETLAESVQRVAGERSFSRIVVLSPNHFRPKSYTFTSAPADGDFPIDAESVQKLARADPQMVMDQPLVENDHGLTIPMTHLLTAFPQAKFVPILVSPYFNEENLRAWAARLSEMGGEETLYVASADFAHDLPEQTANEKDQESMEAMASFDYRKIFEFKDDHMDNPGGMATLLLVMEKEGAKNWEMWERGHGATILGDPVLKGTSYVIGVFRRDQK